MPKSRKPYPPEFRDQLVALVRAGRTPEDLAREFERPLSRSVTGWPKPIGMPVGAPTASPRPSGPSSRSSAARIGS